ncbi:hypothetical protein [Polyangium sp. 15x6]|uniref:hypothetical protein n=1 Tax=Polyangium sp. 15x6 TaxID=3042687 RepID=UPI00249B04A8|nr:hypothetical protein [Polyangium sp. 15x6]MDI3282881.1 hypothetical protein [Polyangium sp. 15x6]
MYSIESHVGRLIEVRFWSPVGEGEAIGWRRDHDAMLQSVVGNYIVYVDMSDANVFPPDMVEAYVATMRNEPRLLRAALVLSASPTLSLQIQRILRDAFHPHRRAFREVREAENFLGDVVTLPERARLREVIERRAEQGGPISAQPASVAVPQSTGTPPSLRGPVSARAPTPATVRIPITPRSPSGGHGEG